MKFRNAVLAMFLAATLVIVPGCSAKDKKDANSNNTSTSSTNSSVQKETLKEIDFDAEGMAQTFVDMFTTEKYDDLLTEFTYIPDMKDVFTKEAMTEITNQLVKSYGAFESTSGVMSQQTEEFHIVSIGVVHLEKDLVYNVVFNYEGEIAGFNYKEISSVEDYFNAGIANAKEYEVTFGSGEFIMNGTLSVPDTGKEKYPVVVLVHGSGPNDRDETIYGNKPFKDIAAGLLKQDIAVLRYDKRTFTYKEAFAAAEAAKEFTIYDEVVEDAQYAVDFLSERDDIDADKIYVLGHSLGGNQAPRIAKDNDSVAGLIVMAGNVTTLQNLIVEQYKYIMNLDGSISEEDQQKIDYVQKAADLISSDKLKEDTNINDLMGIGAKYWMDIRDYNPAKEAAKLDIPMLILQGERDYQVPAAELELWKEALGDQATYKLYSDLNHLFMKGEGMSTPDEYIKGNNVSEQVIEDIANWILDQK